MSQVSKVVVDAGVINGQNEPLMIYEGAEQQRVAPH